MRYVTTREIIIPAGTEVTREEERTSRYATPHASVLIEVTSDITAEWMMDFDEAVEAGLIRVTEGPSDGEELEQRRDQEAGAIAQGPGSTPGPENPID
jgi:hypothetical protein